MLKMGGAHVIKATRASRRSFMGDRIEADAAQTRRRRPPRRESYRLSARSVATARQYHTG